MKKLFLLFLFAACSVISYGQASFTLITAPCNNNGILQASFTSSGLTPPLTVRWFTQGSAGTTIVHTGVAGLTDILTGYSGGPLTISATDPSGMVATGTYLGAAPFNICPLTVAGAPCPGPDTLSASVCGGGTPPFHYTWYNIGTSGIVGTMNPIPVTAGSIYGVTVTDAAGCTYGSLVDPMQAFAYIIPSFVDTVNTTPANCTNGTASVTTFGAGVPPYTYLWSTGATTPTIGSLTMGFYHVTVTDAVGCSATGTGYVPQLTSIFAPVVPTPTTCAASDGAVMAFGSGGMPPYTYLWSNGATTSSQSGIPGGFYDVEVTDANGCRGTGSSFVGVSTPIAVTYTMTPSLCTAPTGTATLTITGGTLPYTVMWYTTPAQTGTTAIALTSGTYSFKVTDALGCTQTGSVFIPPISTISASFLGTPATCTLSNGNTTVYPTGGVLPYTYLWSTGATTAGITGKPAGSYSVVITDNMGCKLTRWTYLSSTSPVHISATATPATCIYANNGMNTAYAWGGTPPYAYGWSTGGTTSTISSLATGPYWAHATDALGCTTPGYYSYVHYDTTGTSCYCTIEGTIYHDASGNCIQDFGEKGLQNIQVRIAGSALPGGSVYTYTDANGHYSYKVPSGTYTISESVPTFYPLSACQLNNLVVTAVAGTGCVHTVDFSNSMDTIHDMHISTFNVNRPVPGNTYTQAVIVTNDGTVTEDSVLANYRPDGQIFSPSFVPGSYFTGVPYMFTADTFTNFTPGASKRFLLTYTVPTNIPLGTNLVFKDTTVNNDTTSTWLNDATPWNNVNYFNTEVVASYDPNFKEVSPRGTGPAGTISYTDSVLEYNVHFQNTGTYMAQNIMVIDTLDDNLNWTSMRPGYSSSPCRVTLTQSGTRKIATFTFENINLPPQSQDEVRSNGMFTYTIRLRSYMPVGTQFRNRASIYFDYNEPIMTNTTLNTLGTANPGGVHVNNVTPAEQGSFTIYPNPANKSFSAIIASDVVTTAVIKVSDITGREMMVKPIALNKGSQTIPVDVAQLASGTYFVTLNAGTKTQTQKLVIIK